MSGQVRTAVIGLGRLGYWHAENLATKVKGAQLVKVVDPLEGRAEQVARELGVPGWSKDPREVFEDANIDAVVLVTPTSTHAEMITQAATHGKQIFVEKPITQTVEEADEVIQVLNKHNVFCQVGFMRRFDPAYAEAKRRIAAGDIGKPLYFKGVSRDGNCPPAEFIKHSGGLFLDVAIHDYDIARFLMGTEVETVTATGNVLLHTFMKDYHDVDQAVTTLTFASGAAGDIETMRIAPYGYDIRGEVIGTEGSIQIGSLRHHDVLLLTANASTHDIIPDFPTKFKDAYLLEMIHFIDAVQKRERPACTETDGKIALEIAAAATESFQTAKTVKLDKKVSI
ncbi:inositol 2-dehydrogenase [Brevibacillus agri]|uniref:inositol 2-dehydrogenase n=1 Tax=Brevibacillus agri TaxID=51101 RepID=UPI001C8EED87|nr:inositol 2-dehydrogenase [Brevibacillus agri]MBY0052166.1 inositol 2-dehydrogenase [Brevibacillus agri]MDN4093946.1 inositol 2-dehydrogenase [Brevibacillus agri]